MAVYVPKKVEDRIKSNLSKYKRILKTAKDKDIKEADTVSIIRDMLADMMGWDKYSEITKEYETQGTYCDLGIKIDGEAHILIEVKRVGIPLDEKHLKQAKDYASNEGTDWVILTNGVEWNAYKVLFRKPVTVERVFTLNLLEVNARNKKAIEQIYSISREGVKKEALKQVHEESQVTNRFVIAGLIMSEPVVKVLKREIK
ncbi:MAG: type I restriction enzyme HsdR N-terminal domain-containing protein, partial [Candidatus Hydrothermarchaeaceae archaeon]